MTTNDTATPPTDATTRGHVLLPAVGEPVAGEGQIILFEQWGILRRTWKLVVLTALVASIVATAYAMLFVPKEYQATVTVVPPNKASTPLDNLVGGLSSSLKDFGLAKLVGGKSGESGYSRVAVLFSRTVVDSLIARYDLWNTYEIPRNRKDLLQDAVRANILIEVDDEGPLSISVYDVDPKRSVAMAEDIVRIADAIARDLNRRETEPISSTIGKRYDQVRAEQERLGTQLKAFMQNNRIFDPEQQPALIGTALYSAEAEIREQKVMTATLEKILGPADTRVVQSREILRQLEGEVRKMASGQGGAVEGLDLKKAPAAVVEGARLQTAYEVNAKVLALLQPMYEQSVIDEQREIPTFQVLDPAQVPLTKARPRYSLIAIGSFLGSFALCYVLLSFWTAARSFNKRYRHYLAARASASVGTRHD